MKEQKNLTVLSSILKRAPENVGLSYLKFLPESTVLEIQSEKSHKNPVADISFKELLDKIDESWYLEVLSKYSKPDLVFYLSLFPEKKRVSLAEKLSCDLPFYSFSKELEIYHLNILFGELFSGTLPLPLSYLPDSPISFLLNSTPEKLNKLSFYLGLFDVSIELKSVINGSILKNIEKALFPDEINFCRNLSEFRQVFSLGQMGLSSWNEDSDSLREVIFNRGLYRLSIGIRDENSDFIWYIKHTLSKNSALMIEKFPKNPIDAKAIGVVLGQIQTAWTGVCTVLN
jgi:hypothetical protein